MNLDREILNYIAKPAEKGFEPLALRVFAHQYANNRFYRRLCEIEGMKPAAIRSWKEIPAMPAAGFKELVLTSFPKERAVKVFKTSGTTRGAHGAHFFDTLKLYEAAISEPFKMHVLWGYPPVRFYFLTASPKDAPHSSLSHMMGAVNRRFAKPAGKFYVRGGAARYEELARDLARERKKVLILATAFSLKGFLEFLEEEKIKLALPRGSRLMETGGFKGRMKEVSKASLYKETSRLLGIRTADCVSEYGMTELSSQFYSRAGRAFEGPAWIRTLVVDPATGREAKKSKAGVLRHFDLANRGSVMAVQTEDVGRAKGRGFGLIGRASGAELRGCSLTYEELLKS
jgi:hypothetical protein